MALPREAAKDAVSGHEWRGGMTIAGFDDWYVAVSMSWRFSSAFQATSDEGHNDSVRHNAYAVPPTNDYTISSPGAQLFLRVGVAEGAFFDGQMNTSNAEFRNRSDSGRTGTRQLGFRATANLQQTRASQDLRLILDAPGSPGSTRRRELQGVFVPWLSAQRHGRFAFVWSGLDALTGA